MLDYFLTRAGSGRFALVEGEVGWVWVEVSEERNSWTSDTANTFLRVKFMGLTFTAQRLRFKRAQRFCIDVANKMPTYVERLSLEASTRLETLGK